MKLYKFSNNQVLTSDLSELKGKSEFAQAQKGKWYHFNRIYVIKSGKGYGLVSLNFFERLNRNICKVNYFKKPFEGRLVTVISAKTLRGAPVSLKELEAINTKTKDAGVRGAGIFVDITARGGGEAIQVLRDSKASGTKKCHFGVACFVNYSLAAASKADKIILFDYDPVVVRFNRMARDLLLTSSNREEFKQKLTEGCQKDREIRDRHFYPFDLASTLAMKESFLSREEDFQYIKKLAEENKVHILQGSIYDQQAIVEIVKLTKREGYAFDTLFISNVYEWDPDQKKRALLSKNIQSLRNDQTKVIEIIGHDVKVSCLSH